MSLQKVKQIRELAQNPPPALETLLTDQELSYLEDIAPGLHNTPEGGQIILIYPVSDQDKVNELINKLTPLNLKFGHLRIVGNADQMREVKSAITPESAKELKMLYQ